MFSIRGRDIYFNNRQFKQEIRCIPKDTDFERRIILSRNRFPPILKEMFNLPEKDKKEYEEIAPLGEKALADKSVEDLKKHGLLIIKVEEV